MTQQIEFTRIKNDINGNPRFVCHFLNFLSSERQDEINKSFGLRSIGVMYDEALAKSRQLGGRKFHNKQYGGGIVFQMYDGQKVEMSRRINEIANS